MNLFVELANLLFGFLQMIFQSLVPMEGRGSSTCTNPQSILGDALHRHELLARECGHSVDQKPLEQVRMLDAKVGEGMVVHGNVSAESPADFVHKIAIASQEIGETGWWLKVIQRAQRAPKEDLSLWISEARQRVAILTASARTAKAKSLNPPSDPNTPAAKCRSPVGIAVAVSHSSGEVERQIHKL